MRQSKSDIPTHPCYGCGQSVRLRPRQRARLAADPEAPVYCSQACRWRGVPLTALCACGCGEVVTLSARHRRTDPPSPAYVNVQHKGRAQRTLTLPWEQPCVHCGTVFRCNPDQRSRLARGLIAGVCCSIPCARALRRLRPRKQAPVERPARATWWVRRMLLNAWRAAEGWETEQPVLTEETERCDLPFWTE